jgi:anti-repressor protein
MNNLKVFENAEFGSVRTIEVNGAPYFVGKDVAEILGYSNTRKALIDHVDEEDKGVTKCDTLGGIQDLTVINESGLYSLILSSKLPTAKKFKHWVTSEVLPAIRKTGLYATDELINNPDLLIKMATALKAEREKAKQLETVVAIKQQQIAELKPKADYVDNILKSKSLVTITQIAKDYGMSGTAFNKLLHKLKVQYKQGRQWLLYSNYQSYGYTHSETINIKRSDGRSDVVMETKWTQKGRLFLYNLLKKNGYLPIIERSGD